MIGNLTKNIKIGISLVISNVILFVLIIIIMAIYPDAEITTYSDEKFIHPAIFLLFISAFLALFGLGLIFFDRYSRLEKGLKNFTIASLILAVICIFSIVLASYWMFLMFEYEPKLMYGIFFLLFSPFIYAAYLIFFWYTIDKSRISNYLSILDEKEILLFEKKGPRIKYLGFYITVKSRNKIAVMLTVILFILTSVLIYHIQDPNRFYYKIELNSRVFNEYDYVEYQGFLVNNNLYTVKHKVQHEIETIYIWKEGNKKEETSASESIYDSLYKFSLGPFQKKALSGGGFTADVVVPMNLLNNLVENLTVMVPQEPYGKYYIQGHYWYDGNEFWSEPVSFVIER